MNFSTPPPPHCWLQSYSYTHFACSANFMMAIPDQIMWKLAQFCSARSTLFVKVVFFSTNYYIVFPRRLWSKSKIRLGSRFIAWSAAPLASPAQYRENLFKFARDRYEIPDFHASFWRRRCERQLKARRFSSIRSVIEPIATRRHSSSDSNLYIQNISLAH